MVTPKSRLINFNIRTASGSYDEIIGYHTENE
ncbi:hypothetical protein YPC_0131 [Yersinia pestis biovar Medievalis str. Harbin 35]|nr:hypothetical protein YPC_0131 [Yersinia pestis biovar Medievalis str. Harbin 35]EEO74789.1 hypothetical protein YP516_4399 [Yersinia pestis Nepal516]EEO82498.1 hypothetical protein YPF_0465 [Yersinia pestis biovar Orientalis str. India 195]EEO86465.1 hypothetical protein YPH_2381 [Yersinia pestis biovar Orientalis str. PEXU2]EEO92399.1 hypothetical protein YPS_0214 [Yersinia pestis Pestoides A]